MQLNAIREAIESAVAEKLAEVRGGGARAESSPTESVDVTLPGGAARPDSAAPARLAPPVDAGPA